MLRNNSVQLEMFKADEDTSGGQSVSGGNPLYLKKIRGYQKSIYTFVVVIFVSLVSFSFGVEKGKNQIAGMIPRMKIEPVSLPAGADFPIPKGRVLPKVESAASLAVEATPLSPKPGPVLLVNKNTSFSSRKIGISTKLGQGMVERSVPLDNKTEKVNLRAKAATEESIRINYTIQVASISNSKNVAEELSKLKNRGYTAFSLHKGKYTVVCVGRFSAREDAQINLAKMKNSYPDCQIRRL